MKRIMLICVIIGLCTLITASARAQSDISWGVKAGASIANIHGDDWGDSDSLIGLVGGLFVQVPVVEGFSVQPELLLSMKGSKADYRPFYLATEKDSLVYLEAPVLAKGTFPAGDRVGVSLFGGPSFGLLVSATYKLTGPEADLLAADLGIPTEGNLEDVGAEMADFELGLVLGGGLEYRLARGSLVFDLRYTLGLTNVMDMQPAIDAKNGVFAVMTGYTF